MVNLFEKYGEPSTNIDNLLIRIRTRLKLVKGREWVDALVDEVNVLRQERSLKAKDTLPTEKILEMFGYSK